MAAYCLAEDMADGFDRSREMPAPLSQMDSDAREEYWAALALRHCPGLGARSRGKLLKGFQSAYAAVSNPRQWQRHGVPPQRADGIIRDAWRKEAEKEWRKAMQSDAKILLWRHFLYPPRLRELPDAPALLYLRGDAMLLPAPAVAIVGSRNPTDHGRRVAELFSNALADAGITVVSGMALGIDRHAHMGALRGPGKSVGVLGAGVDIIYPRSNGDIYAQMLKSGLLLSEFPPGCPPMAANFPIRNRIISGLSLGVLVVEAAERSGSLVTARLALEQNREVFAVPAQAMSQNSLGCQNLIRQGARAVFTAEDVLRDLADQLRNFGLAALPGRAGHADRENAASPSHFPPAPAEPPAAAARPVSAAAAAAPSAEDAAFDAGAMRAADAEAENAAISLLGSGNAEMTLNILKNNRIMHMDALAIATGLHMNQLSTILLGLEMTGKIRRLPGGRYEAA